MVSSTDHIPERTGEQRPLVAVFDNIRSLYNVGSMFRTADAFALDHLYLCGLTGTPETDPQRSRIAKSALGAEQTVPWSYVKQARDALAQLKNDGFTILALEQTPDSISLSSYDSHLASERLALVVGHELFGVSEAALALADHVVHIPMLGSKESLNVTVAFGIAAAWLRQ